MQRAGGLTTRPRVVGILGGMGPAATADFYTKLIAATPAATDQAHLAVAIWADPSVPDRSESLLGRGVDPTPWLEHGIRMLQGAGAELLVVPCNTAHAYIPRIALRLNIHLIDMIEEAATYVASSGSGIRTVGLIATTGTISVRLYQDALAVRGVEVLVPSAADQESVVMPSIAAVKSGSVSPSLQLELARVVNELGDRGADAVIAGCTEVSIAVTTHLLGLPLIDPSAVLARAVVQYMMARS